MQLSVIGTYLPIYAASTSTKILTIGHVGIQTWGLHINSHKGFSVNVTNKFRVSQKRPNNSERLKKLLK